MMLQRVVGSGAASEGTGGHWLPASQVESLAWVRQGTFSPSQCIRKDEGGIFHFKVGRITF